MMEESQSDMTAEYSEYRSRFDTSLAYRLFQHLPALNQEFLGSLSEYLILFPDKAHTGIRLWCKRAEAEVAFS